MKKEKARGMYYEFIKEEFLFISIPALKQYFIKPKNIIGNFSHNCTAYIFEKENDLYAEIMKKEDDVMNS